MLIFYARLHHPVLTALHPLFLVTGIICLLALARMFYRYSVFAALRIFFWAVLPSSLLWWISGPDIVNAVTPGLTAYILFAIFAMSLFGCIGLDERFPNLWKIIGVFASAAMVLSFSIEHPAVVNFFFHPHRLWLVFVSIASIAGFIETIFELKERFVSRAA